MDPLKRSKKNLPYNGINWKEQVPFLHEKLASGTTIRKLGVHYGVTCQRIQQILQKHIPTWKKDYKFKRNQKTEAEFKAYKDKWGDKQDTDLYVMQRFKFSRKKTNASRIGYEWTINFGDLVWPTHCPILGLELDYFAETRQENSVSFDRIDSSSGYVTGNVLVLSWRANRIKNDGTAMEHRKIADFLDSL